jgi:Domain of unknown function (DUF4333)
MPNQTQKGPLMQSLPALRGLSTSRSGPPIRNLRLRRTLVVAGLLAASVAVSACGSSGSPTILNTEKIERAIEYSSLAQRGTHTQVSCPSGVHQQKGLTFTCAAVVGRSSAQFIVTELDGSGHVHYLAR